MKSYISTSPVVQVEELVNPPDSSSKGVVSGPLRVHRCLRIVEVLQVIAYEVERPSDLISMALTCRSFFDPAMNALWRDLGTMDPLFLCLPGCTRRTESQRLTISGPLSPADWLRFRLYSRRVHRLTLFGDWGETGEFQSPPIDWGPVTDAFPEKKILPNLRALEIENTTMSCWYPWLMPPTLEKLTIEIMDSAGVRSFIDAVPDFAHTLKILDARISEAPEFTAEIAHAITSMPNLVFLAVTHPLPPEVVDHLASLPGLRQLRMELSDADYHIKPGSPRRRFAALEELSVTIKQADDTALLALLEALTAPKVKWAGVYFSFNESKQYDRAVLPYYPSKATMDTLFDLLATFATLHTITVSVSPFRNYNTESTVDLSTLFRLFVLRDLDKLDLSSINLRLMPDDIEQISLAWPYIRRLDLGSAAGYMDDRTRIKIQDLLPFAEHCPDLWSLGCQLSFPERPERPRKYTSTKSQSSLSELQCLNSTIHFSPETSASLATIFPHAELYVGTSNPRNCLQADLINRTKDLFVRLRKEERNSVINELKSFTSGLLR